MFKIFDWAGNEVNTAGKTFPTFDAGWDWVTANVKEDAWVDMYVLQCDGDGKPVENE